MYAEKNFININYFYSSTFYNSLLIFRIVSIFHLYIRIVLEKNVYYLTCLHYLHLPSSLVNYTYEVIEPQLNKTINITTSRVLPSDTSINTNTTNISSATYSSAFWKIHAHISLLTFAYYLFLDSTLDILKTYHFIEADCSDSIL